MSHTKDEVLECAEAYEALGEPVGASYLRAYATLLGSEPVAWITTIKCVGPEYGKQIFAKVPIQSLQPGYYSHTPLFELPGKGEAK